MPILEPRKRILRKGSIHRLTFRPQSPRRVFVFCGDVQRPEHVLYEPRATFTRFTCRTLTYPLPALEIAGAPFCDSLYAFPIVFCFLQLGLLDTFMVGGRLDDIGQISSHGRSY